MHSFCYALTARERSIRSKASINTGIGHIFQTTPFPLPTSSHRKWQQDPGERVPTAWETQSTSATCHM